MPPEALETPQKPLLGIPLPQAIPFDPARATPAEAEEVYRAILARFAAYARSAAIALPVPSIVGAALWTEDRMRWLLARLTSGAAGAGEAPLTASIIEAAASIFEIFQRWLAVGGGAGEYQAALDGLQRTLQTLQSSLTGAPALDGGSGGNLPALAASAAPASGASLSAKPAPKGAFAIWAILAVAALTLFRKK